MTTLTRPNGKIYRPRSGPAVDLYEDLSGYGTGVVVVRTHDILLARLVAADQLAEHDLTDVKPHRAWWRLVPWGYEYDSTWLEDPVRGSPVVVFSPDDSW